MPMDIVYPVIKKPKHCTYTVVLRQPCESLELTWEQKDLLQRIFVFDELEGALFALEQLSLYRGYAISVGWSYVVRRVEKNNFDNPQSVILVSWTRLPDLENQCPGTATGKLELHATLNCI